MSRCESHWRVAHDVGAGALPGPGNIANIAYAVVLFVSLPVRNIPAQAFDVDGDEALS
jgi:hypothetical protein